MKITFLGDFLYNSGSTQTVAEYYKVAKRFGVQISISGFVDEVIKKHVPILEKISASNTDVAIFIFENIMYLDPLKFPKRIDSYLEETKKIKRIVIDTDANFGSTEVVKKLSNIVLQPKAEENDPYSFLFFSFPKPIKIQRKKYDAVYLGNNWHREKELTDFLNAAFSSRLIKHIEVRGNNWHLKKLKSKIDFNGSQVLTVKGSVTPDEHLDFMSEGKINPVLINKDLINKHLVTPRMFETFAADTVPLLPDSADYLNKIYGPDSGIFFCSDKDMKTKIEEILEKYSDFLKIRDNVRLNLNKNHSFEARFKQLLDIINNS